MASNKALLKVQRILQEDKKLQEAAGALYTIVCRVVNAAEELAGDDEELGQVLRDSGHLNEPPFRLRRAPVREGSVVIRADGATVSPSLYTVDYATGVISTDIPVTGVALIEATFTAVGYRYQVQAIVAAVPGLTVEEIQGKLADYRVMKTWLEENFGFG